MWTRTQDHRSVTGLGRGGSPPHLKSPPVSACFFYDLGKKVGARHTADTNACASYPAPAETHHSLSGGCGFRQSACATAEAVSSSRPSTRQTNTVAPEALIAGVGWFFCSFCGWQSSSRGVTMPAHRALPGTSLRRSVITAEVTRRRGKIGEGPAFPLTTKRFSVLVPRAASPAQPNLPASHALPSTSLPSERFPPVRGRSSPASWPPVCGA
jgi:hypothetical protein